MSPNEKTDPREALIRAGTKLFTEKSYDSVSTRELADEAQVNLGAIQYHFGSKGKLFVATIYRLMEESRSLRSERTPPELITTPYQAAAVISNFIREFLQHMLFPEGPQACRIMFREILTTRTEDTEVVEGVIQAVVDDFIAPDNSYLHKVFEILKPEFSDSEREFAIQSLIGQCAFHFTHGPFAARLAHTQGRDVPKFESICEHIIQFTLGGVGCDRKFVEKVLADVRQEWQKGKSED